MSGLVLALAASSCTAAPPAKPPRPADSSVGPASLRLERLPPVSQPGSLIGRADAARTVLTVTASPATPGARVVLQRRSGSEWKPVARAVTDAFGRADFVPPAPVAVGSTYRAVSRTGVRSRGQVDAGWRLAFSDEFDRSGLGPAWSYRALGVLSATSGRTVSASAKEAVEVSGGTLRLKVAKDPDTPGHFLNGHVSTEGSYLFRHGVAAARIRFQRPRGAHGAFWSQSPTTYAFPGDPARAGAEIDIAEYFGQGYPGGGLASYVHHVDESGKNVKDGDVLPQAVRAVGSSDSFWRNYHVFSVEWSPQGYVFRVDGRVTFATRQAVSQRSQYLVLSLLSSDWELPDLDERLLPGVMSVDWVRVWQRGT